MWGGKDKRTTGRIDTLVGKSTEIVGDVAFSGGLHVDGTVRGDVVATTDPQAVVSISEHGGIEGEVRVPNVVVNGTITGDVYASERLELGPGARVEGNVFYNLIEMASGAAVNGKLVHQAGGPKLLELRPAPTDTATG